MSNLILERHGRVLLVTLNRPEALNALVLDMRQSLVDAFDNAARDPEIGAVVVTGAGRDFCSGGDIRFMKKVMESGGRFEDFRPLVAAGREVALSIHRCGKPVIAAVNGAAAGGGMGLALMCDTRWASEKSRFAQSFAKIGLHPDWGSLYALPRLVGTARALELMWTGDMVDAAEALRIGIVTRVLPADQLLPEAMAFADRLARGPAVALSLIKRSVWDSLGYDLEQALAREIDAQEGCWNTRDSKEGVTAFLEKRPAKFEGR